VGSDDGEVGRVFPEVIEVNTRGRTNWLWIKPVFGVCGELWLVSGYSGVYLGFLSGFLGSECEKRGFCDYKNVDKTWWIAWFLW
jgi:hypothetical protein